MNTNEETIDRDKRMGLPDDITVDKDKQETFYCKEYEDNGYTCEDGQCSACAKMYQLTPEEKKLLKEDDSEEAKNYLYANTGCPPVWVDVCIRELKKQFKIQKVIGNGK